MKKTIARLILAGWVVLILGVLTIAVIQDPLVLLAILIPGGLVVAVMSLYWAIDVLDIY